MTVDRTFGIERSIAFTTFSQGRVIALFGMERSIALYDFFSGKGDRTFSMERSIALCEIERAIVLYD
jgi:hypothetical protein